MCPPSSASTASAGTSTFAPPESTSVTSADAAVLLQPSLPLSSSTFPAFHTLPSSPASSSSVLSAPYHRSPALVLSTICGSAVNDSLLTQCAELFSLHYGVE